MVVNLVIRGCCALFIWLLVVIPAAQSAERYAALVVEVNSGKVLFERYASERRHPASLTKMMTLYMVFEALQRGKVTLQTRWRVSKTAASRPPTKLGLKVGQTITVEQAILALVTHSANDVAAVVGEALGKSEYKFAQMMTRKARALGMKRSNFRNASGLPDRYQVTTAWDMYRLARALQTHFPKYYRYFSTTRFQFREASHSNHNRLLGSYAGTDGIKTGYIRASGFNLVASVRRGRYHLIGIVFGGRTSKTRNAHMRAILDQGFKQLKAGSPPVRIAKNTTPPPVTLVSTTPTPAPKPQPTAPKAPAPTAASKTTAAWAIQVGAFSQLTTAEKQTSIALVAAPDMLLRAEISIAPLRQNGKTIYRARFNGLSQSEAHTACQALQRKNIDCIPLPAAG